MPIPILTVLSDWVPLNVYIVWSVKSGGIDISSKLSIFSSPGLAGGVAEGLFLALPVLCHSGCHHDHLETVCQQKQICLLSCQ